MKAVTALKQNPPKVSIDANWKQLLAFLGMFVALFIVPILAVNWEPSTTPEILPMTGTETSVITDNTHLLIPIINFKLDTTFKEPATISFTVGVVVLIVSVILIVVLVKDYRKKQFKYDYY